MDAVYFSTPRSAIDTNLADVWTDEATSADKGDDNLGTTRRAEFERALDHLLASDLAVVLKVLLRTDAVPLRFVRDIRTRPRKREFGRL